MADRGKAELPEVPDHRSAPSDEVVEQPWEELVEDLCASGHQHMGMPALGDTTTVLELGRERVAVHHRDALVGVGQHPGGEEPGHARTQDHRLVTNLPHRAPLALWQVLRR
jgi:hypothetical protein